MDGPTAQIAALTCHLNAVFRGVPVRQFFPDNSTCQFCEFVRFARPRKNWLRQVAWQIVAQTPDDWFELQRVKQSSRAVLVHLSTDNQEFPDRLSAGLIGGGGRWLVRIDSEGSMECWEAGWRVGDQNAPSKRIWQVQYSLVEEDEPPPPRDRAIRGLIDELTAVLPQIEAFARRRGLAGFADRFFKALQCLRG
jgi:hypothetical protein